MSLAGESLTQGLRDPMQSLIKLFLIVASPTGMAADLSVEGYTGVNIVHVTSDNTIILDIPSVFNNLYEVDTNPTAQSKSGAMLMYHLGNMFIFPPNLATNLGRIIWFSDLTESVPPLPSDHTRVWFTCVKDDGTTFIPLGANIALELGIANNSVVSVLPIFVPPPP